MLVEEFGDSIEVVSEMDKTITGNFNIRVDGELVHSKTTKNHGFYDSNEEQRKVVVAAIKAALGTE